MKKEEIGLHFQPGGALLLLPPPSKRAAWHGQELCSPEAGFWMPTSLQPAQGDFPTRHAEQLAEGTQSYLQIQQAPLPSLRLLFSFCCSATDRLDFFLKMYIRFNSLFAPLSISFSNYNGCAQNAPGIGRYNMALKWASMPPAEFEI